MLRAWLHVVRDRLTVDSAAHLGAQLPELLRGTSYGGWVPSRVPIRYDSAALREKFSHGQLDHVFTLLPAKLRVELSEAGTVTRS